MSNDFEVGDVVRVAKPYWSYERGQAEIIWIDYPYATLQNPISGREYTVRLNELEEV
jgi:hypothetical protein